MTIISLFLPILFRLLRFHQFPTHNFQTILRSLLAASLLLASLSVNLMAQEKKRMIAPDDPLLKVFEPREFIGQGSESLQYRLMKPIDYKPGRKYPLVIFLHGAGERGDDNVSQLVHGAREFAIQERRRQYPAYVLFPQCPKEKRWVEVDWRLESHTMPSEPSFGMNLVKQLVDTMIETAGIDETRVYITGLSMGGFGVWDAIARYEGLFAAAAPICGGGDPTTVDRFADLPIWAFHGAQDPTVKVKRTQDMIEALKAKREIPSTPSIPRPGTTVGLRRSRTPSFIRGYSRKSDRNLL